MSLLVLVLLAPAAEAGIYKYVDRNGDSHYTDSLQQVPLEYRNQVRDLSADMQGAGGLQVIEGLNGGAPGPAGEASPAADLDVGAIDLQGLTEMNDGSEMVAGILESFGFGLVLLFLLAIPALYVVSALIFKLACRIAGEDPPGLGRACLILLAQGFAGGAVSGAVAGIATIVGLNEEASIGASIAVAGSSSLLSWMVNAAILASMESYAFVKSMWIGVLHTLLSLVMIGGPIALIAFVAFLAA